LAADQTVKNNPDVVPATSFAIKDELQRQIIKPKKQEFAKSAKQAENFAEKLKVLRPKKSHANC
jgi:hypothetical protein